MIIQSDPNPTKHAKWTVHSPNSPKSSDYPAPTKNRPVRIRYMLIFDRNHSSRVPKLSKLFWATDPYLQIFFCGTQSYVTSIFWPNNEVK